MPVQVFEKMIGQVFTEVATLGFKRWPEKPVALAFSNEAGEHRFEHAQDCCESVWLESIDGDLADLVGEPITMAEEVSSDRDDRLENSDDSYTWTFYKFATAKGFVTVRFYGTSNGYYSEGVTYFAPGSDRWGYVQESV